jgi:hypothetical protein
VITKTWLGIGLVAAMLACASTARAQSFDAKSLERIERDEPGVFDGKPLFVRRIWTTHDGASYIRLELFESENPDDIRKLPSQARRTQDSIELAEDIDVLWQDTRRAGPFEDLGSVSIDPERDRVVVVDWPPVDSTVAPYPFRRTRELERPRRKSQLAEVFTEVFVPKIDRLARMRTAIDAEAWADAWRSALALDPFAPTDSGTPACDPVVGQITLDLLIAHLDALLADKKADDAHRVLSLAFKFGGPRAAACGITSSGIETGLTPAFVAGTKARVPRTCGRTTVADGKGECAPKTSFEASWSRPDQTRAALMSFAEFAAARGDLELVRRIVSGIVERRYHDPEPPAEYRKGEGAAKSWPLAWMGLGDAARKAKLEQLQAAAYTLALDSEGADDDLDRATRTRLERDAVRFEPQTVSPDTPETLERLIAKGALLMAIGEVERYSRADLKRAKIVSSALQTPVVDAMDKAIAAAKKAERADEASDLRALRGKARWLNPLSR